AELSRRGVGQRVLVEALEQDAIADLVHAAGCPTGLVDALEAQSGGNPLFVRELIANFVESGGLAAPEELRELIAHRAARLSEPTRRMLTVAAVAGPSFSLDLLEHAIDGESDLLDEIEEAVGAELLNETRPDEFAFAHALVRQTLYELLGSTRRTRLHRRLGEAHEA